MLIKINPVFFLLILTLFNQSCVSGFSNRQNHIPPAFSNVYLASAGDVSPYAGNSIRLSFAIRNILAQRSDLNLTSLETARWVLEIKVLDRQQSITAVDSCKNPGTQIVGNGAFACSTINQSADGVPKNFNAPSISPSSEQLYLVVQVRAIDLNNGRVLWGKRYSQKNTSPAVFSEIGDNGDGRTISAMQKTPDLHTLRYQEAVDNAVQAFSKTIAIDIQTMILSLTPAR